MLPCKYPTPLPWEPPLAKSTMNYWSFAQVSRMSCRRMYDAVIQEQNVLPNGVRLASILAGSLVRKHQAADPTKSVHCMMSLLPSAYVARPLCPPSSEPVSSAWPAWSTPQLHAC